MSAGSNQLGTTGAAEKCMPLPSAFSLDVPEKSVGSKEQDSASFDRILAARRSVTATVKNLHTDTKLTSDVAGFHRFEGIKSGKKPATVAHSLTPESHSEGEDILQGAEEGRLSDSFADDAEAEPGGLGAEYLNVPCCQVLFQQVVGPGAHSRDVAIGNEKVGLESGSADSSGVSDLGFSEQVAQGTRLNANVSGLADSTLDAVVIDGGLSTSSNDTQHASIPVKLGGFENGSLDFRKAQVTADGSAAKATSYDEVASLGKGSDVDPDDLGFEQFIFANGGDGVIGELHKAPAESGFFGESLHTDVAANERRLRMHEASGDNLQSVIAKGGRGLTETINPDREKIAAGADQLIAKNRQTSNQEDDRDSEASSGTRSADRGLPVMNLASANLSAGTERSSSGRAVQWVTAGKAVDAVVALRESFAASSSQHCVVDFEVEGHGRLRVEITRRADQIEAVLRTSSEELRDSLRSVFAVSERLGSQVALEPVKSSDSQSSGLGLGARHGGEGFSRNRNAQPPPVRELDNTTRRAEEARSTTTLIQSGSERLLQTFA